MKKILIILFTFFVFNLNVEAKEVNLYLFYGEECPHCEREQQYLEELKEYYDFNIVKYETWHNEENAELMASVKSKLNIDNPYVPFTVIDNLGLTGFNDNTKAEIESRIKYCLKNKCNDIMNETCDDSDQINDNNQTNDNEQPKEEEPCSQDKFTLPVLGEIHAKDVSLPIVAIVIGFIDGFNPCAMWILIFLISFLISTGNEKKMKILGTTFLATSGIIYFLFMMAWINITAKMTQIIMLRNIIAVIAIIAGAWNLKNYLKERKKDSGCSVTNKEERSKIIEKIKKYVTENNIALAMLGIMALAISVNVIELACSAGLPLLFTQILTINNLNSLEYFIYVLIYIIFFLIDDIVIFLIAVKTAKVTGISNKYTRYSHLIGGLIMIIIGALLIFKPEIIMFNF